MTESEWLSSEDPTPMLAFIRGTASDRKLRLFAVACCRRVWPFLKDERSRTAVEISEAYADRRATKRKARSIEDRARNGLGTVYWYGESSAERNAAEAVVGLAIDLRPGVVARAAAVAVGEYARDEARPEVWPATGPERATQLALENAAYDEAAKREKRCQTALLREVYGNPFRPVTFDPTWLTTDVVALARGIDNAQAFARMPILADALQDAGCTSDAVLAHCRDPNQVHVPGCWVVDGILGNEGIAATGTNRDGGS